MTNGCIALTEEQIAKVSKVLKPRDLTWFTLGLKTGLRIGEVLSLQVEDISHDFNYIKIWKRNTKGQVDSRVLPVHPVAKQLLQNWVSNKTLLQGSVFVSRKGGGSLDTRSANKILREAFRACGIEGLKGQLGTHVMRKTFAKKVYEFHKFDIVKTMHSLGHKNLENTAKYIRVLQEDVDACFMAS